MGADVQPVRVQPPGRADALERGNRPDRAADRRQAYADGGKVMHITQDAASIARLQDRVIAITKLQTALAGEQASVLKLGELVFEFEVLGGHRLQ